MIHGDGGHDYLYGDWFSESSNVVAPIESKPAEAVDDVIFGGTGNDLIVGDDGREEIFGGWGNDVIIAHRIGDVSTTFVEYIEGGANDDFVCGTNGQDTIYGGTVAPGPGYDDYEKDRIGFPEDPGVPLTAGERGPLSLV